MKKILAFVLAVSMLAGALASCSSSDEDEFFEDVETYGDVQTTEPKDDTTDADTKKTEADEKEIELIEGFEYIHLLPVIIEKDRFETEILSKITDSKDKSIFETYYTLYDISDDSLTDKAKDAIMETFPICEKYAIYWCAIDITPKEMGILTDMMVKYCPDYTYEDLARDSEMCGYTQEEVMELRK